MSSRVLETVLTGRNLLSPVLAGAARDVTAYDTAVTRANSQAAASAQASANVQTTAASRVQASAAQTAAKVTSASAAMEAARKREADALGAVRVAEARLQQVQQSGRATDAQRIAAQEAVARAQRGVTVAQEGTAAAATRLTAAQTTVTASSGRVAAAAVRTSTAADAATLSLRAQQAATQQLAASNGLLGTSLTPLTAGLGAVALGLGYAAFRGMAFGGAMAEARAASGATGAEFEQLRDTAVNLGADTKFSSEEAAQGITEMAKAGVSTADILSGGLKGALDLAAAGQMDVADAAELGATAMNVFNLEGDQMSHVADLLAAGAGKAQGSVHDMGMALNQSALVAAQAGLSIEDTAGALAMFASNGLVGSDAGTSFKTMLQALTPNSEAAATAMAAIGFSAYDAQGNFIGLEAVAGQLQTGLAGLSEEQRAATLETIFGSDAVRAASVLYAEGAAGVNEWAGAVNDAGYAARTAAALSDYLGGDLEKLGGAVDAVATSVGDAAQGPLRLIVQTLTHLVDIGGDVLGFWSSLPGPVQTAVVAFAAFHMLKGPLDSMLGSLAGGLMRAEIRMGAAGGAAAGFRSAVAGLARTAAPMAALAGLTIGIDLLSDSLHSQGRNLESNTTLYSGWIQELNRGGAAAAEVRERVEAARETFARFGAQDEFTAAMGRATDATREQWEALSPLEQAQQKVTQWTNELSYAIETYGANSEQASIATEQLAEWTDLQADRQHALDVATADSTNTMAAAASASGDYTNALIWIGDATGLTQEQIEEATDAINDWRDTLAGIQGAFVDPLAVYTGQVEAMAQATADATEDSTDSWEDYASDTRVSLDDVAAQLQEQIMAQYNWRTNIVEATQRGGVEVGQALAAMGIEGAGFVQQMVDATDEDFARMAGLMAEDARLGGSQAAAELDAQMRVMAEVGRRGSQATVQGIASELGIGADVVRGIASQYGVNLAEGVNPLLQALGQLSVTVPQMGLGYRPPPTYVRPNADGNVYENHQAEIAPGGAMRVWAEPETMGESYIPHAPAKRAKSLDIWRRTGEILNAPEVQFFADGGFTSVGAVPRPSSTAPYGPPLSTAANAAMQREYDAATSWLRENLLTDGTFGASKASPNGKGGLGPRAAAARAQIMDLFGITNIGGYANRNIAGTGVKSDHATGHAIDVMIANYKSAAGIAQGNAVASHLINNAAELGVKYVIWRDRIHEGNGWAPYGHPGGGRSDTLQHRDHVHGSFYDQGGLAVGAGYLPKATIAPERVLDPRQTAAFEDWMRSPAAMPGYGMGGGYGGGSVSVAAPNVVVHARVFLGNREITDIVRVEADSVVADALAGVASRGRYNG